MSRTREAVAPSLAVVAVVWLSLRIVSRYCCNRNGGRASAANDDQRRKQHSHDSLNHWPPGSRLEDRTTAADTGNVFSLYTSDERDAEPTSPMKLSEEVYSLLKSFDVDAIRGVLYEMRNPSFVSPKCIFKIFSLSAFPISPLPSAECLPMLQLRTGSTPQPFYAALTTVEVPRGS